MRPLFLIAICTSLLLGPVQPAFGATSTAQTTRNLTNPTGSDQASISSFPSFMISAEAMDARNVPPSTGFDYPIGGASYHEGYVMTNCFGCDYLHYLGHTGEDFDSGAEGGPVYSASEGVVVYRGAGPGAWGNVIIVQHNVRGISIFTQYAHLRDMFVVPGQVVGRRQQIATVGMTGTSVPHLHFEVKDQPVIGHGYTGAGFSNIYVLQAWGITYYSPSWWIDNHRYYWEDLPTLQPPPGSQYWSQAKILAAADYDGDGKTELAALYDYDNANTALFVFDPDLDYSPQLVWSSGPGGWEWQRVRFLAAADYDGDGRTELAALYDYGNANTGIFIFDPDLGYTPERKWLSNPGNWDGVRSKMFTAANYDGDTGSELAIFYDYGNANTGLFVFDPDSGYTPERKWLSGAGGWEWARTITATTADQNGDGKSEVAALYDYGNANTGLFIFDPGLGYTPARVWLSGAGGWEGFRTKTLTATDQNGNGRTELSALYDYGNANTGLFLFDLAAGYTPQRVWLSNPGNWEGSRSRILAAADFDGDVKTELAMFYDYGNANAGIFVFDPDTGYMPQRMWLSGAGNWEWFRSKITVGDRDGNARAELAVLYNYGYANTGLFFLEPASADPPQRVWLSGYGHWDWFRSKL